MTKIGRFSPDICVIEMILILLHNAAPTTTLYHHTDLNMINFRHEVCLTPAPQSKQPEHTLKFAAFWDTKPRSFADTVKVPQESATYILIPS